MGVEDLIKHIRPEAFRRVLKREGWSLSSRSFDAEDWFIGDTKGLLRFFRFNTFYFGPDVEIPGKSIDSEIQALNSATYIGYGALITQLLDHSFQIYAELEDVVQRVSSYGGAGSLSVNEVLPDVFEGKLKWAIEDAARYRSLELQ